MPHQVNGSHLLCPRARSSRQCKEEAEDRNSQTCPDDQSASPPRRLFPRRRPAHPEDQARVIELALVRIDRTAIVESENFVREVQSRSDKAQSFIEPVTALDVDL